MNPGLPEQPDEIVESAYACYQEGAAIVHIHARDKNGIPTGSKEVFQEIHDKIRSKCPIIVQDSTGGGPNLTLDQRIECIQAKPDMASLNMGSLMRISGQYKGVSWSNMPEEIEHFVTQFKKARGEAGDGGLQPRHVPRNRERDQERVWWRSLIISTW